MIFGSHITLHPERYWVRFFGLKDYPPRPIAEAAILPSGTIVVMTEDDGRGRESLWFDPDGSNPKGESVLEIKPDCSRSAE